MVKSVMTLSEVRRENKKAYNNGRQKALNTVINSVALHLLDKGVLSENPEENKELVSNVLGAVLKDCEEIIEGRLDVNDIRETLKSEYDITIWFK